LLAPRLIRDRVKIRTQGPFPSNAGATRDRPSSQFEAVTGLIHY